MKTWSRFYPLFTLLFVSSLLFVACSDDDDSSTGPIDNGPAIQLSISPGDYFNYDRWSLDADNNKSGDTWEYRITYLDNNDVYIGAYKDFVYLKEENRTEGVKLSDETAMRADADHNLFIYNFQHDIYVEFFELLKQFDASLNVTVPYQQWDTVAYFNDASGNANPPGFSWDITADDMVAFNFNIEVASLPQEVNVTPEVMGYYDGQVSSMTINGKEIKRWQIRRVTTMKIRSSILDKDLPIVETITYSDDPNGIITYKRESATISLQPFGSYTLPGEEWNLTSFVAY